MSISVNGSARKHGIDDEDALQAVKAPAYVGIPDDGTPAKQLVLGFDRQGRLLEITLLTFDAPGLQLFPVGGLMWGNPFVMGRDGDRAEVIRKYEQHLLSSPALMARLGELKGKTLACFCAPRQCHGHVLAHYEDQHKKLLRTPNPSPRLTSNPTALRAVSEKERRLCITHSRRSCFAPGAFRVRPKPPAPQRAGAGPFCLPEG